MRKLFSDSLIGAILVCLLISLFFLPNLLKGKVPIPADDLLGLYHPWRDLAIEGYTPGRFPVKNPLITDPVLQTYPWRYLAVKNIKEGNLPFWNPNSFSGQPLLGNIQSSPFQLLNILFFILPFRIAWSTQIILPTILAGLFMFLFLRRLKTSTIASIFGGLILPLSSFFIAWLSWGTIVTTAMWLPLLLLTINKLFEVFRVSWFLILIFAVSQTIFSGHWQTAFYTIIATILYASFVFLKSKNWQVLSLILLGLVLGLTLAAPQILPSWEFIKFSGRSVDQGYYPGRPDWFLPLPNLIQMMAPDFFGNPATYNYWGVWNYAEFVSFAGIIPLGFALLTIVSRRYRPFFFVGLAAASLLLALENSLSKIPYTLTIPFISSIQPSRIIFLLVFALCVLSAFGFDYFLKEKISRRILLPPLVILIILAVLFWYTLTHQDYFPIIANIDAVRVALRNLIVPSISAFAFLIICFSRFFKIHKVVLGLIVFTIVLVELFRFGWKFTSFSKPSWIYPQTPITDYLQNLEKPFRVMATDRRILHPNTSSVYGIESVDGYDPLYLASYGQFVSVWQSDNPNASMAAFNRIITPQKYQSKLANLLNVKYVLTFDEINNPNFAKIFEVGETKIYQNKNVRPRAFFVQEVKKTANDQEELARLLAEDFDLATTATSQEFDFSPRKIDASLGFQKYDDQSLIISTKTDKEAPLVLTNIFYPGWQATIDRHQTPIKRANFMFQSVIVPAGEHEVKFQFRPQSFYNGLYVGLAGIIGTTLASLYLWRRKFQ